ncbi:MAG: hypothetical protein QF515_11635 [Pseudomonadales bacterium]|jgi:hypothetical protein|nr:hypothetical protein [Pseudomonadales bacterium]
MFVIEAKLSGYQSHQPLAGCFVHYIVPLPELRGFCVIGRGHRNVPGRAGGGGILAGVPQDLMLA